MKYKIIPVWNNRDTKSIEAFEKSINNYAKEGYEVRFATDTYVLMHKTEYHENESCQCNGCHGEKIEDYKDYSFPCVDCNFSQICTIHNNSIQLFEKASNHIYISKFNIRFDCQRRYRNLD